MTRTTSVRPSVQTATPNAEAQGDGGMLRRNYSSVWNQAVEEWSAWMDSKNRSHHTIRQWRWKLRRLSETYLHRSPWRLTAEDLYTWYGSQGWAPNGRKSARSAVCSFYGWAHKHGRIKHNPAAELDGVAVREGTPRPANDAAVERALAIATDKTRLMLMLGDRAGMRCEEIARCEWSDIGDELLLIHGKGGKTRSIPLDVKLAAELAAEKERREAGWHGCGWHFTHSGDRFVFPGRSRDSHMSGRWVSQTLSTVLGDAVTAHMLRHRYAARLLAETGDLKLVQQCLGHSTPSTTQIYTRVPEATMVAKVRAIDY